jgi:hypothetical protein
MTINECKVSILVDERDGAWLAAGTARGYLALYDLRHTAARTPLATRAHASQAPLRRLAHCYAAGGSGRDDDLSAMATTGLLSGAGATRTRAGPAILYACADGIIEAADLASGRVPLALAHRGLISNVSLGSCHVACQFDHRACAQVRRQTMPVRWRSRAADGDASSPAAPNANSDVGTDATLDDVRWRRAMLSSASPQVRVRCVMMAAVVIAHDVCVGSVGGGKRKLVECARRLLRIRLVRIICCLWRRRLQH